MLNIMYLHAGAELYGADKVLLELLCGLDRKLYTPFVVLPGEGELAIRLRKADIQVDVMPYPIIRRSCFTPSGLIKYAQEYNVYSKLLAQYATENKIDILHVNTIAVLEGIKVKKYTGLPLVWHIHEILKNPKLVALVLSRSVAKYADSIVAVSHATAHNLSQLTNGLADAKMKVIYNGVDSNCFRPDLQNAYIREEYRIPDNAKVFGMIGRINAWKGQLDLFEAAESVIASIPNAYCLMVGGVFEGQEWRLLDLKQRVSESKYRDHILVSDYRGDIANYHSLFDVFVLPSILPDPLPTVVLEAMSCSKPIVGYRHGGVCEMIAEGYNGVLCDVRDTQCLANAIISLLGDDAVRQRFGANSRERVVDSFSLESYRTAFNELYQALQKEQVHA